MHRHYWRIMSLFLIILVSLVGGLLLKRPLWGIKIDVGNEPPFIVSGETATFQSYFLFHASEMDGQKSFRWMGERGTVTLPFALRMQPLIVEIVACRCRLDEPATPVQLVLNNEHIGIMQATPDWRHYYILVPQGLTHPDYSLMVDMRAPVWEDDYGRDLSLAVDSIGLRQIAPVAIADPVSILVVVGGVCILVWRKRPLLQPFLLCFAWFLVHLVYQPQLLPRQVVTSILVGGLLLLWQVGATSDTYLSSRKDAKTQRPNFFMPYVCRFGIIRCCSSLLFTLIAVWLVLSPQLLGTWFVDDAFISLRYAHNFIHGNGLVFNPGEYVEGYTNFLWTMILAGILKIGGDPVVWATGITLVLGFVILALTLVLARNVVQEPWTWVAPTLLAVSTPFLLYTSRGSGMETALFTALILATLVALIKQQWLLAGILTTLTMLTRPDGLILAAVGMLYALWHSTLPFPYITTSDKKPKDLRPCITYSLVISVLFIPYFIWRWNYYGYPLPNTFYVKVGSTTAQVLRGFQYLWQFGIEHLLLFVGIGGMVIGAWFWQRDNRQQININTIVLIGSFTASFALYVVFVGGDWMPGARFFVPITPLLALLSAWGIVSLARQTPSTMVLAIIISVGSMATLGLRLPHKSTYCHSEIWTQNYATRRYREVGRWIYSHTPPDVTIATSIAGALPYYANRPMIDILGLTDEHIAHLSSTHLGHEIPGHEKTDPDYVLQKRPAIVPYKGSSLLWQHPDFKAQYRSDWFHGPEGYAIWLYIRKDVQLQE